MESIMTEYNLAWIVYVGSATVLMLLFYLLTRRLKHGVLALLLRCLVAALLLTPAAIEGPGGAGEAWSPAFIAIVIEFMSGQAELAQSRIQSLTTVTIGLFLLALLVRYLIAKLPTKSVPD